MRLWTIVERSSMVLSGVCSVVSATVALSVYFKWNEVPTDIVGSVNATLSAPGGEGVGVVEGAGLIEISSHALWLIFALLFVASVLLLITGWAMMRTRRKATWNPEGLYVGQIHINLRKLTTDLRIEIAIRCFNGTGAEVDITKIRGEIVYYPSPALKPEDAIKLDSAQFIGNRSPLTKLEQNSELFPVLVQYVSKDLQVRLVDQIERGERPCLSFDQFDILISPSENPSISVRMPLWSALILNNLIGDSTNRLVTGKVNATLGVGLS